MMAGGDGVCMLYTCLGFEVQFKSSCTYQGTLEKSGNALSLMNMTLLDLKIWSVGSSRYAA